LVIALDEKHIPAVELWWQGLTEEQRTAIFEVCISCEPEQPNENLPDDPEADEGEPQNDWYEYVVNQDARFYFDRSIGERTSHGNIVYPTLSAVSAAADVAMVSHILKRTRE
jgi:hypothetical protein